MFSVNEQGFILKVFTTSIIKSGGSRGGQMGLCPPKFFCLPLFSRSGGQELKISVNVINKDPSSNAIQGCFMPPAVFLVPPFSNY